MGETLQRMRNQLNDFWSELDKKKKIMLGASSLFFVLTVSAIIIFSTRTSYESLFNRTLTYKEAATIIEKLDEMGIDWKEGDGFNAILVPKDMKNRIKMELANEGFADDSLSIKEAIGESSWTMTQSDKDRLYNDALSRSLANTISQIDGVASARVFLYKPKEKGFVLDDEEEATASVMITRGIGSTLSPNKILSIQTTVANAVGMKAENVSVIDDSGNLLSQTNDSVSGFDLNERYATQQRYQAWIEGSLEEFLETVFGYGNVAVTSNVDINFDSEITNIVEFKPPVEGDDEGLIRSLQKIEESTVNGSNGGVAGTESNTGDVTDYVQEDENTSKYAKASQTINYELNEINRQISKAPGKIESITVAVLINTDALVDGKLTDEKKQEITKLIYASTGLDTKNVEIHAYKFNKPQLNQNTGANQEKPNIPSTMTLVIIGIGLFVLVGLTGYFIASRRKEKEKLDLEKVMDERAEEMSKLQEIKFDEEKSQFKAQINKFVEEKPDAVAQLLRSWLNED